MRRGYSFAFLILSFALLLISVQKTTDRFRFSALRISMAEVEKIKSARHLTESGLISALSFDGYALFFDELTDSWFYSVSEENNASDPTVDYEIIESENEIKVAFSGEITPGNTLPLIAYTENEYKEYSLVVTSLPLIRLDCSEDFIVLNEIDGLSQEGAGIKYVSFPAIFTLYDNSPNALYPVITSEATIHIRGSSSLNFPKKGIRISLHEKRSDSTEKEYQPNLLGLRSDGDWLLNSCYNDQEKIRNVFSTNLWMMANGEDNSFGIKNGTEYRFVELFLNQQYWGLYAIGYPIDTKQMEIRSDALGHYHEFVFKQKNFGPNDGKADGVKAQFNGYESDVNQGIQILEMYFSMLNNGAAGRLWHNDENNILDIWLFLKLGQAFDTVLYRGQTKNIIYTIKSTPEGYKILYTPWDADIYWGNIWRADAKNKTIPYGLNVDNNDLENTLNPVSILMQQGDTEIIQKIIQRYVELRNSSWADEVVDELLDGFEQEIFGSGAYVRDMERWPDGSYEDPELGLSVFREYVHGRFASMDKYIESLR